MFVTVRGVTAIAVSAFAMLFGVFWLKRKKRKLLSTSGSENHLNDVQRLDLKVHFEADDISDDSVNCGKQSDQASLEDQTDAEGVAQPESCNRLLAVSPSSCYNHLEHNFQYNSLSNLVSSDSWSSQSPQSCNSFKSPETVQKEFADCFDQENKPNHDDSASTQVAQGMCKNGYVWNNIESYFMQSLPQTPQENGFMNSYLPSYLSQSSQEVAQGVMANYNERNNGLTLPSLSSPSAGQEVATNGFDWNSRLIFDSLTSTEILGNFANGYISPYCVPPVDIQDNYDYGLQVDNVPQADDILNVEDGYSTFDSSVVGLTDLGIRFELMGSLDERFNPFADMNNCENALSIYNTTEESVLLQESSDGTSNAITTMTNGCERFSPLYNNVESVYDGSDQMCSAFGTMDNHDGHVSVPYSESNGVPQDEVREALRPDCFSVLYHKVDGDFTDSVVSEAECSDLERINDGISTEADSGVGHSSTSDNNLFQFYFPTSLCGQLIGRHGKNIKAICNETGAMISVRQDLLTTEKHIICINGSERQIQRAFDIIWENFPIGAEDVNYAQPSDVVFEIPESRITLPTENNVNVIVSSVVYPNHVFVQLPYHELFPEIGRLLYSMTDCYNNCQNCIDLVRPIRVGTLCAVGMLYNHWYRAKVINYYEEMDACKIKFVDVGGYAVTSASNLRMLRSDFVGLPHQAVECYLSGIVSPTEDHTFPPGAITYLATLVQGVPLLLNVKGYAMNGIPYVTLYQDCGSKTVNINEQLILQGFAKTGLSLPHI